MKYQKVVATSLNLRGRKIVELACGHTIELTKQSAARSYARRFCTKCVDEPAPGSARDEARVLISEVSE